jgi:RNA recognition motif-containing protein
VGNLPYDATTEEVEALIKNVGVDGVARVHLPVDQDGRKRGFGFVTMISSESANAALEALKGADLRGRRLIINIAHPKGDRPPRPEGGAGGGFDRPPRTFGGPPPGGGFGGPPPPARSGKGEGRKRKFEEPERAATSAPGRGKRDKEERWRDKEDDDW